jgi:hypothetical protein
MQLATMADFPEPFLPTMKLTCGSRSICIWAWFMKFSTMILRITPFSAVCSMATALPAAFLPSDFERLALSSVAGDAEEGVRRFDALESLLLGAADPAARGIDACTCSGWLRC